MSLKKDDSDDESEVSLSTDLCIYCHKPDNWHCFGGEPMVAIMKTAAAEEAGEKDRLRKCVKLAHEFVVDNGGLPSAAPPLIFAKVPFCMLHRMFAEWNVKCPWPQGCGMKPCITQDYALDDDTFLEALQMKMRGKQNNECRYYLYSTFTKIFHGKLGYKNRKQLPKCCTQIVQELFPRSNGEDWVGFQPF